ncbi:hypothetical protein [Candidatus Methylacidithermus pantelleriae]|uniref:hypothetical protein n=1 Tax=Candidatus Methylacidithermus pantelleriae TaxID=2744239 RepID=UPI00157D1A8C|nr:hypothetical protein [Candidatus Methylacidithermus pantelleriae]
MREPLVPTRNGACVTVALPPSNGTKQVWSFSTVRGWRRLKAALATHARSEANRLPAALLSPKTQDCALSGLCQGNPGTQIVGSTVRPASRTIFPGRGTVV